MNASNLNKHSYSMFLNFSESDVIHSIISSITEESLTPAEQLTLKDLYISSPVLARYAKAGLMSKKMLAKLPKVNARPNFDQKMAAAFSLELQKEEVRLNTSWLRRKETV